MSDLYSALAALRVSGAFGVGFDVVMEFEEPRGSAPYLAGSHTFPFPRVLRGHLESPIEAHHLAEASKLCRAIEALSGKGPLRRAVEAFTAGPLIEIAELHYLMAWIGLESLFGYEQEMSFRIPLRLGHFLGTDKSESRAIFDQARLGYGRRSKIVHGGDHKVDDWDAALFETDELLRKALSRILSDDALVRVFDSKNERPRSKLLDGLLFA